MAIFNSYVSLPEGIPNTFEVRHKSLSHGHWLDEIWVPKFSKMETYILIYFNQTSKKYTTIIP